MNEGFTPSEHEKELRKQAENRVGRIDPGALGKKSREEVLQLFHELQVHQVELEVQQEELHATAHALRESEARYRHLYQFAPNGYFTLTPDGNIEGINYAAARLLGVEPRLVPGQMLRTFVQVNCRPAFDDFFASLRYLQEPQRCEVTLLSYGRGPRNVLLEGTGLGEEPAVGPRFLVSAVDITEWKAAEVARQAQTDLLESVMQAVLTGVVVFDCVRGAQGRVVDFVYRLANPYLEQLVGRPVVGSRLLERYPGMGPSGIFARLKHVADTGVPTHFEQYYGYEGFHHWFRITAMRLGDSIVSSVEDVTERKRMEEENLRMRLSQQKALLQTIMDAQEEERRRISESLHNGVGQILYATQLNLARIDLDKMPLSLEPLRQVKQKTEQLLSDAIRETRNVSHELIPRLLQERGLAVAMEDFCRRFSHTGIQLACHGLEERLDPYLETAIYRISQELVNNIAKHAGATRARIEVLREGGQVVIEAQDNGKGIDPDKALAPGEKGKGIGLKTIQDRVKLLEGRLSIEAAPGGGTLITISLPVPRDRKLPGQA
jgi:PAS domain S-box-containing protein